MCYNVANMKKIVAAVFLLPLLTGCLTATVPDVSRWLVEYRPVKAGQVGRPVFGVARLTQLIVRSPYNTEGLAVLRANGTVAFDPLNEYAAQPSFLLRGIVLDALTASGLFDNVIGATSKVAEDYAVEVTVTRLALDCRKDGERKAVAEVVLRLVKGESIAKVAEGSASIDAADGNYGEAFSRALSVALSDAMGHLR